MHTRVMYVQVLGTKKWKNGIEKKKPLLLYVPSACIRNEAAYQIICPLNDAIYLTCEPAKTNKSYICIRWKIK